MTKWAQLAIVPSELLSKEFLSQFKSEEDVSQFLKGLPPQVLEQILDGELDAHWGYEKHSQDSINTSNSTIMWRQFKSLHLQNLHHIFIELPRRKLQIN